MSAQTSYERLQPVGLPGLIYAQHPHDVDSRDVETVAGIAFGVAVSRGTDKERQCVVGGTDFIGITIRSLDREGAANTGAVQYDETDTAGILRRGYIWVTVPSGCTAGDPANYVNATGVIDSGAAVAGETSLDGATFETSAAAGELAVLRLETTATTAGV